MTTTKRVLYTLGAAALLLGAAPALADGGAGSKHDCRKSCPCAHMAERHDAKREAPAQASPSASAGDRDAEFLSAVWSAP